MKSFKTFISEHTGYIWDKDHLTLYHGTHKNNIPSIRENGLNKPDEKTGMISLTPDPDTAHGYAAMSGEHNFRAAGNKAVTVPHKDRRVVKFKIPRKWAEDNHDKALGGNIGSVRGRFASKEEFEKHDDNSHPYQLGELRFKKPIPSGFMHSVLRRKGSNYA